MAIKLLKLGKFLKFENLARNLLFDGLFRLEFIGMKNISRQAKK